MPILQLTLVQGRDEETIQNCVREVARTVARTLDAPLSTVRIAVQEVPPTRFAVGDELKSDA
ncbi:MAG: 4-oxalocrotonate tautomerase [Streptosporangiales bacterium]|nr:4-oxalocrotonate tautomerase [Streptosporangiales bacterium]